MGHATPLCFAPPPLGPGEVSKGQISSNFNYKVNFKVVFIANFMCVRTTDIERDFHSVAWLMAQGLGLGVLGVKNIFSGHGNMAF